MKTIFNRLSFLLSPVAVGIYITLGFTWTAFLYFVALGKPTEETGVIEGLLITAHQKSIDFRLKARGERKGSPLVGLLTVDDRAVKTVGRWPWPRETTSKAIAHAIQYGAKVIAFDMVFSEPSFHPTSEAFKIVSQKVQIPDPVRQQFEITIADQDSDQMMAKFIGTHSQHLVLGSFGSVSNTPSPTEQFDSCMDLIFTATQAYKQWTEKETPLIAIENRPEIPDTLKAFYRDHLHHIEEAVREGRTTANSLEQHDLNEEVLSRQTQFCSHWLDAKNDETYQSLSDNWNSLAEIEGQEFLGRYPTFDAWVTTFKSESSRHAVPQVTDWTMDLPLLTSMGNSFQTGYFNANLDSDGTIRKTNLILHTGTTYMPSIALKAYLLATNRNAQITFSYNRRQQRTEVSKLEIIDENGDVVEKIPVESSGRLTINYAGRQKIFPYVSLADLLTESDSLSYETREYNPKLHNWQTVTKKAKKAEFMKDKLFILGASATGIFDLRVTPFEENYPGVETHANVLDNLLRHDFLISHPNEERVMLITLLFLGIILSFALAYLSALPGLTLVSVVLIGISLFDKYFLFGKGTVVTVVLPLALTLILFIFLISYRYFTEERSKRELRGTFQKYVSPAIVEEILSDPAKIELGGRKTKVTIFFSDVRGFTTISEKLDPRALSDLLNEYLTPMTDLIFKNRGTLDKYMGDAIMAFFGAPIHFPDHPKLACRCALQNIEKLFVLQAEFKRRGLPEIDVGIGLNTGEVSVGNMGSQTVRSYTVMGDAVNLASRLEGINKQYGTRIIISEFTFADVKNHFVCREIDWVRVKGKVLPVKIYELIAEGTPSPKIQPFLHHFHQGYNAYHQMQWSTALDFFHQALQENPQDEVTQLYIERTQNYQSTPPPADWDGVFVMTTK